MSETKKFLELSDGNRMPILGYGTMDFQAEKGMVKEATVSALKAGFRHFDCAAIYQNEAEVGEALEEIMPILGLKREDIFVTGKLPASAMKPEDVIPSLKQTLKDLRLEYLDLYLVHFPVPLKKKEDGLGEEPLRAGFGVRDTWREMEKLKKGGLSRSIGVSNFNVLLLNDMLCWAEDPPVVNQIERHPYLVQQDLVDFCKGCGVVVCAYSPLGTPGTGLADGGPEALLKSKVIQDIAVEVNGTPAQVLIQWSLSQDIPPMPKSVNPKRIQENFASLNTRLSQEQIALISGLDRNHRYFHQKWNGIPAFA